MPFDLVASAFVLLACWDERTTGERDRYGRLPYSASIFAANPALRIEEPAVDRYAELLRSTVTPRLAELGLEPLPAAGSVWGARGRFAIALTHDLDNRGDGLAEASPPPPTAPPVPPVTCGDAPS